MFTNFVNFRSVACVLSFGIKLSNELDLTDESLNHEAIQIPPDGYQPIATYYYVTMQTTRTKQRDNFLRKKYASPLCYLSSANWSHSNNI